MPKFYVSYLPGLSYEAVLIGEIKTDTLDKAEYYADEIYGPEYPGKQILVQEEET